MRRLYHKPMNDLNFTHRYVPGGPTTLLLLHGTGGSEKDLLALGEALRPEAGRLSPRGQVLEDGMPRFFRRLAAGVFDQEDLVRRTHELADFVEAAASAYGFDPAQVIAVGYSNGANIAASVLLLRPAILSAAVLFHPMVPLVPETPPHLAGKPVFIGAGRYDTMIEPLEAERLSGLLRRCGADVTLHWENGGHALNREEVTAARDWLASLQP